MPLKVAQGTEKCQGKLFLNRMQVSALSIGTRPLARVLSSMRDETSSLDNGFEPRPYGRELLAPAAMRGSHSDLVNMI